MMNRWQKSKAVTYNILMEFRTQWNGTSRTFRLDIRKWSSLRGWSVTATAFPGKWSWHQACQNSGNILMMFVVLLIFLGSPGRNREFDDFYGFLSTSDILCFHEIESTVFTLNWINKMRLNKKIWKYIALFWAISHRWNFHCNA